MKNIYAVTLLCLTALLAPSRVSANETPSQCVNGMAVLAQNAQTWHELNHQFTTLYKNIAHVRDNINSIIEIDDDLAKDSKTAQKVQKVMNLIAPGFELVPEIQTGLENIGRAAEISDRDVLSPAHKIANDLVSAAKLREIRDELNTQVLPRVSKLAGFASQTQARVLKVSRGVSDACRIAEAVNTAACSRKGFQAISDAYTAFRPPVLETTKVVSELNGALGQVNALMEKSVTPVLKPVLVVERPLKDVSAAFRSLDDGIHQFEHALERRITIHVDGLIKLRFSVKQLLKDWKKEVRKFEHLVDVDALKREMRKEIEAVLEPEVRKMTRVIKRLENSITIDGLNISDVEKMLAELKSRLALEMPIIEFQAYEKADLGLTRIAEQTKSCG